MNVDGSKTTRSVPGWLATWETAGIKSAQEICTRTSACLRDHNHPGLCVAPQDLANVAPRD